jgi:hypothetical protein
MDQSNLESFPVVPLESSLVQPFGLELQTGKKLAPPKPISCAQFPPPAMKKENETISRTPPGSAFLQQRERPPEPWASRQHQPEALLLAAGVLRVAGEKQAAMNMLERAMAAGASSVHAAALQGAMAFDAGDLDKARAFWTLLPEGPTRWHNTGLLAWLKGEPARDLFSRAAAALDDSDPWHHLAALYADVATT